MLGSGRNGGAPGVVGVSGVLGVPGSGTGVVGGDSIGGEGEYPPPLGVDGVGVCGLGV